MRTLRRIFALPRNRFAGLRSPKALVLLLVIIIPGGLVLPICYGLYGALRHTLATKVASRGADAPEVSDALHDASAIR